MGMDACIRGSRERWGQGDAAGQGDGKTEGREGRGTKTQGAFHCLVSCTKGGLGKFRRQASAGWSPPVHRFRQPSPRSGWHGPRCGLRSVGRVTVRGGGAGRGRGVTANLQPWWGSLKFPARLPLEVDLVPEVDDGPGEERAFEVELEDARVCLWTQSWLSSLLHDRMSPNESRQSAVRDVHPHPGGRRTLALTSRARQSVTNRPVTRRPHA
jgi:hypothetical protein